MLILKDREKELRLNQIKIKEISKLLKHNNDKKTDSK